MKKVLSLGILSILSSLSLYADYMLVLTDSEGNQTQECVKSYSFSNNLESLVHSDNFETESLSLNEVRTNKKWIDGKPIYKRVFRYYNENGIKLNYVHYLGAADNIEQVITGNLVARRTNEPTDPVDHSNLMFTDTSYLVHFVGYAKKEFLQTYEDSNTIIGNNGEGTNGFWFKGLMTHPAYDEFYYTVEYTKTIDTENSSKNTFISYLHYVPSSSNANEVVTKNMEELGVQFLKNYIYDSSINSCTKVN